MDEAMSHHSTDEAEREALRPPASAGYTAAPQDAADPGDGRGGGGPDARGPEPYYSDEWVSIYHGDALEVLPLILHMADAAMVDPPYGVSGEQNTKTAKRCGGRKNDYGAFVDSPDYVSSVAVPVVEQIVAAGVRAVLTPGNRCLTMYPEPDSFGAAYQPASVGLQPWGRADAQPILYYGKSPHGGQALPGQSCSYVLTEAAPRAVAQRHPCPKPVMFWAELMKACSKPGETVLDPFMGSGTTLLVAKRLGRRAIGIELEKRHCDLAIERLAQGTLFGPQSAGNPGHRHDTPPCRRGDSAS